MNAARISDEQARQAAMRSLIAAPRTEQQIRDFLSQKGFPPDIIANTLDWLRGYGYVDDVQYAHSRASAKTRAGTGRRTIEADLRRKGIPADIASEAVAGIPASSEQESAERFAAKKIRTMANLPPDKQRQRLTSALARRGFPPEVVYSVVDDICPRHPDHGNTR